MSYVTIETSTSVNDLASTLLGIETLPPEVLTLIEPYVALHWIKHINYDKMDARQNPYIEYALMLLLDQVGNVLYKEHKNIGRVSHADLVDEYLVHDSSNIVMIHKYSFSKSVQLFNLMLV